MKRARGLLLLLLLSGCGGGGGGTAPPPPPPQNQPPTASFTFTVDERSVDFDASGSRDSDGTITGYAWTFGDGSTGTGMAVNHIFDEAGDYTVTLTITDNRNATNRTTQRVTPVNPAPLASFTYEEDPDMPFGIRFDATDSTGDGDLTDYTWDFGESSRSVNITTGTGVTPRFVYDGRRFFRDTHGGEHGYEGYYPATATYTVTLTVTDRHGVEATHTEEIAVTNTLAFTGARALIDRITDDDEHRGTLVISELGIGEAFEGSHAQTAVYVSMKEEGIPTERIHVQGPGITDRSANGPFGLLTHPDNAALRAETLVMNRSVFPAFGRGYGEDIAANNIVFVGGVLPMLLLTLKMFAIRRVCPTGISGIPTTHFGAMPATADSGEVGTTACGK